MKVKISDIVVNERLRHIDRSKVAELSKSINEVGLINPITITKDNVLIAGNHRIEAMMQLCEVEIEANVIDLDNELLIELVEIDENLIRNELHYIDRGRHTTRREQILEDLGLRKPSHRPEKCADSAPLKTTSDIAKEIGISKRTLQEEKQIVRDVLPEVQDLIKEKEITKTEALIMARMKPEEQKQVAEKLQHQNNPTVKEAIKEIKKEEFKANIQKQKDEIEQGIAVLPTGVFEVISIDPPWNYGTEYDGEGRRVANPYPEMSQSQLKELQLPSAENSVLFLWTTQRFIWDAKELLNHWGFTYRNMIVWDKDKIGMGDLFRMQCEFCLVGIKGKPVFDNDHTNRDIIREARREHSRKPDSFFDMVDKLCVGRKLEYFSREVRKGWEVFGNDTNKF